MATSNFLAEFLGILFVVIPLALLINQVYIKKLFEAFQEDKNMFCQGLLSTMAGLAIILVHNIWIPSWQAVITALGWLMFIKGAAILLYPDLCKILAKKLENSLFIPYALMVVVILGLIITYLGFTA